MNNFLRACFFLLSPLWIHAVDIAITIDDFPMSDGALYSANDRTDAYIKTLSQHKCTAAFFCIGKKCTTPRQQRLLQKLDQNGHFLCNHTMTHLHLSELDLATFRKEVEELDSILSQYTHAKKWFRYPFLDYGNREKTGGSIPKMLNAHALLQKLDHTEGYVTINTFDWHIDTRLAEAVLNGKKINLDTLRAFYLERIRSWCKYYIDFFSKKFGDTITHTLLLHANDLNALFLGDIIAMIKKEGWNIVSPEKAFHNTSWRKEILKDPALIIHLPPSLNCDEIDKQLLPLLSSEN